MDIELLPWAAGLFEGEGWIVNYGEGRKGNIRIGLQTTDYDVLERFAAIIGMGKLYGPFTRRGRPGRKPFLRWECFNFEAVQAVGAAFWPWLGTRRRDQLRHALTVAKEKHARRVPNPHGPDGKFIPLSRSPSASQADRSKP